MLFATHGDGRSAYRFMLKGVNEYQQPAWLLQHRMIKKMPFYAATAFIT